MIPKSSPRLERTLEECESPMPLLAFPRSLVASKWLPPNGCLQTEFHTVGRRSDWILAPPFPAAWLIPAIIPLSFESEGEPTLSGTEVTLTAVDFPLGHSL
jgi:hypothetical protein